MDLLPEQLFTESNKHILYILHNIHITRTLKGVAYPFVIVRQVLDPFSLVTWNTILR